MQQRLGSRPMAVVRIIFSDFLHYFFFCTGQWFLFPAMPSDDNERGGAVDVQIAFVCEEAAMTVRFVCNEGGHYCG